MTLLIVGLILFLGIHLIRVFAPGFRNTVIERFGKPAWIAGHSILSTLTLVLVIYGFGEAREVTGMLWYPPVWMAHIAVTLMLVSMICLVAAALPPGYIAVKTKYPVIVAIKIWALAHLLANGETSSVLLFVSFLIWAVLLRIMMKRRERAGEVKPRVFVSAKYDIASVVLGAVLWAAIVFWLHEWLIGVAPLGAMG